MIRAIELISLRTEWNSALELAENVADVVTGGVDPGQIFQVAIAFSCLVVGFILGHSRKES